MPVKIDATTKVATTNESSSVVGKMFDGITGMFGDDALTSSEAFWGQVGSLVGATILVSKQARANVRHGNEPLLGLFF